MDGETYYPNAQFIRYLSKIRQVYRLSENSALYGMSAGDLRLRSIGAGRWHPSSPDPSCSASRRVLLLPALRLRPTVSQSELLNVPGFQPLESRNTLFAFQVAGEVGGMDIPLDVPLPWHIREHDFSQRGVYD